MDYKEIKLKCINCKKTVKRVVRKSSKSKKYLCQQCAKKITT